MPFNVNPDAIYPLSTIIVVVLGFFIGIRYFATCRELVELEKRIAEKYVLKEDIDRKLDEFKQDTRQSLQEIKADLIRIYDKIDTIVRA